jgi:uncharacterized membrane protein YbhN (UPF0104 family)
VSKSGSTEPVDAPQHDRIHPDEAVTLDENRRFHFVPARVFSSAANAPRARRPTDWLLLFGSLLGLALVTLVAPGPTEVDTAVAGLVQALPGLAGWFWEICYFLLVGWAVVLLVLPLVRPGRRRLFADLLLAVVLAAFLAIGAGAIAGTDWTASLDGVLNTDPPAVYLGGRIAIAVAVVATASPHLARPLRVVGRGVVALGAIGGMALGVTLPNGALAGFLVGWLTAALVHLLLGSPGGRLTVDQVQLALSDLGVDVADLRDTPLQPSGVALMTGTKDDGSRVLVKVYGRDAWDGQFLTSAWSSLWTKGVTPQLSMGRLQQVEHEAYVTLLAQRAGVAVMPIITAGDAADGDALLVSDASARPLLQVDAEEIDNDLLSQFWVELAHLHALGVAHGWVDGYRLVVRDDHTAALADLGEAKVAASHNALMVDRAQLLVSTALIVGDDRAVAVAGDALGVDGLVEVLPFLQPAVLDRSTRRAVGEQEWDLKALRQAASARAAVEPPELAQVRRVTWGAVVKTALIGVFTYVIIATLANVDFQQLIDELKGADMALLALALLVSPTIQVSQTFSTIGASIQAVRFKAVLMLEYGIQFIALAIPSSAARLALEIRFFQSFGVGPGGATSISVIDSVSGFVIQIALILVIMLTGLADLNLFGSGSSSSSSSSTSTSGSGHEALVVLLVLLVAGIIVIWVVPKYRAAVKAAVPRFRVMLRDQRSQAATALGVLRHVNKVLLLLGGNLGAQLLQALVLGICLKAFGQEAALAQLILINTAVSLFAGFMPIPGGMGVAEAGYTAGLQAIGVPAAAAMSTAIAFRLVTFYLPPLWGGPAMRWLRTHSYV